MSSLLNRRAVILGLSAAPSLSLGSPARASGYIRENAQFAALERSFGGRIGVMAINNADSVELGYRSDERFPLCSTFKVMAASTQAPISLSGSAVNAAGDTVPVRLPTPHNVVLTP